MVLIPFIFGIVMIFFNIKNIWGWLLMFGSMIMLLFGIILNLQIYMQTISALEILIMLVLIVGGAGLMLRGSK
ncbi:MAG: hypothetical protein NZ551_02675 [Microscillaceae bacterium]|nr:hypothetical protein [Microscillaceae bacterium]MDW8460091.1 hypothetical protein [Cytophagales bacterium]